MAACDMAEQIPQSAERAPAADPANPRKDDRNARDLRRLYKPIITPHTLRHNYATMCWENDIDVYSAMRLLGHSSIKTTMDIYTHLTDSQLGKMTEMVDDMFSSTSSQAAQNKKSCTKVAQRAKEPRKPIFTKNEKPSKTPVKGAFSRAFTGDPSGTRTRDTLIKSQVLYRLS